MNNTCKENKRTSTCDQTFNNGQDYYMSTTEGRSAQNRPFVKEETRKRIADFESAKDSKCLTGTDKLSSVTDSQTTLFMSVKNHCPITESSTTNNHQGQLTVSNINASEDNHEKQCENRLSKKSNTTKTYTCEICDKVFTRSGPLKNHIRIHTGDKPFECHVCGKTFSQSGTLQRHLRIHTGVKPCKCNICGKSFIDNCNLQSHVRTHTGEKPYKCVTCEKTFSWSSDLQKHLRTHTGEKPYKCDICGKAFSQSGPLHKHCQAHTRNNKHLMYVLDLSVAKVPTN